MRKETSKKELTELLGVFRRISPKHTLFLGLFLLLLSNVGSTEIADESVTVPPNDYIDYTIQVYPGQNLKVGASVKTENLSDNARGVLEVLIMDDENFYHFQSEEYGEIDERYRLMVSENFWERIEVNTNWFGKVHVILNNKIRANNRDAPKNSSVVITMYRPLGYLALPSLIIIIISSYKILKDKLGHRKTSLSKV